MPSSSSWTVRERGAALLQDLDRAVVGRLLDQHPLPARLVPREQHEALQRAVRDQDAARDRRRTTAPMCSRSGM